KLPLVQQVLTDAVDVLDPSDTISIVTYAGSTAVRLEPTPVADAATIKGVIESLTAGGSTAGAAGIDLAYEQAQAGFIDGGINHVILCTDGDFNVGPYSTNELLNLIIEKRKTGVTLTTLGFGSGNLNDAMMEAVSDAGNGIYSVISSSAQAQDYAQNRLLNTLVRIAKDMKIQVEFNPANVYAYRLLGYEDRAIADSDFRNDIVDAGEVGAGHRVTALYELVLTGHSLPDVTGAPVAEDGASYDGPVEVPSDDLVLVKVRYKHPDALDSDPALEVQSTLTPSDIAADNSTLDADFQWALGVASFAEILKESPYAVPSRLPVVEALVKRPVHASKPDRSEFVGLFSQAKPLIEAGL
ncbi:MAG TPA: YfbK domain-containing protein, partial [Polyangiaceae bacterium]|nr:YfbK domain-containing protein [Polyangiaceae bacterium]